MPDYRVSKKAQEDIRNIGRYTQMHWGRQQRRIYLTGMEKRFEHLVENPFLAPERTEFAPPVRIHPYEKHLIVYTAEEGGIFIVRVLHEKMDLPVHLANA